MKKRSLYSFFWFIIRQELFTFTGFFDFLSTLTYRLLKCNKQIQTHTGTCIHRTNTYIYQKQTVRRMLSSPGRYHGLTIMGGAVQQLECRLAKDHAIRSLLAARASEECEGPRVPIRGPRLRVPCPFACTCPSARARRLPARALPMPARALCLHVFVTAVTF